MSAIMEFQGGYRFLSNFWPAPVTYEGMMFPSVEHAYQATKTLDLRERARIATLTAGKAKSAGRHLAIRPDWNQIKETVMLTLLRSKFEGPLHDDLLATGDAELVEGNWWGDTYWGVCRGKGENRLGKLLMQVRQELAEKVAP